MQGSFGKILAKVGGPSRELAPPLVLALPPLAWLIEANHRVTLETLGRDQGIFQYIAWAVSRGAKDYRDIRDVNGPLTHVVHMLFLALGGADEHRFRTLDLAMSGLSFAVVGACLPGLSRAAGDPAPSWFERAGWAVAAWVVLTAQYFRYVFWDLAQRESFFDWFMLVSVGLQLVAQSPLTRQGTRRLLLIVAGAASIIPWFGKPTYAVFTLAQLLTLIVAQPRGRASPLRRDLAAFALGGSAGALTQIIFLLVYADIGAFVRLYFVEVPALYRFIWPRTALETLCLPGRSTIAALGLAASALMLALIVDGQLPRRLTAIALMPVCGLASILGQGKGFPYHFHPVSAGLSLNGLVLVLWLSEQSRYPSTTLDSTIRGLVRLVPIAAAAGLSLTVTEALVSSPHLENFWIVEKGSTPALRQSRDYFVGFDGIDFFPWEMRQTAEYLRLHTGPNDRVQMYGMDPYLLFLAQRMSATPYIYAYDLDVDFALNGSSLPEGLHPTWEQAEHIRAIRDEHERDFLERLVAHPPSAFVFMDGSPLMTERDDAWLDFSEHCGASAAWVAAHYVETARFGHDRVWMRREVAELPQ